MSEEIGRREFIKRGTIAVGAATTAMPLAARVVGAATVPMTGTAAGVATYGDVASPPLAARRLDRKEFCLS
jgi:hypothetical protein